MTTQEQELRELDVWVAEHVMGWKWYHYTEKKPHWFMLACPSGWQARLGLAMVEKPDRRFDCDTGNVERYTTNSAAAMSVLRECITKAATIGASIDIEEYRDLDGFQGVCVRTLLPKMQNSVSCVADTLELAISLFAKKMWGTYDT